MGHKISLADDVLRPRKALDAASIRLSRHPSRIVGFDARSHTDRTLEDLKDESESSSVLCDYPMAPVPTLLPLVSSEEMDGGYCSARKIDCVAHIARQSIVPTI